MTTVLGGDKSVGLSTASVDLAFMCATYHHIEYPQAYMRSLFRALRPGGTLMLIDFERIEGKTPGWRMRHVRAGKETVIEEVTAAGFVFQSETDLLKENYVLRFIRSSP